MARILKKLNILILSWRGTGHPHVGGAEIVTFEHAKAWVKAGHKVTLFTSFYNGAKTKEWLNGVNIIRKGGAEFSVKFFACIWYLFRDHEKFDIVVDEFHGIPFFTPLYIRTKKIAFIHEVAKEVWFLNYNTLKASIGYYLEPWIFKLFYKNIPFMTVSASTKKDLTEWGILKENITVVHNGVIIEKPHVLHKSSKNTITFLGTLSKDKGVEDALYCFSILKQRGDFNFWIIGKSESDRYQKELKELTKELGLEEKTVFYGFVSQSRKFKLLAGSHLLIHPSVREGWGLVVIEAAAVGTPTIGYKVVGLKDSIIDNKTGMLTRKNTPEEMAKDVYSLLMDQPRYIRMCHDAKKWSNKFSWANSVEQSLSLLKSVYEKKKEENAE